MGIARSLLYLEIARGMVERLDSELRIGHKYFWDAGRRVYEAHRQNSHPPLKLAKAHTFVSYAERQRLEERPAPDTICGVARRSGPFEETV